jgi:hypothetical protein
VVGVEGVFNFREEWWGSLWVILRLVGSWNTSGRNKGTHSVEPRESFGLGGNEDSRPSEDVRYFALQKSPLIEQHVRRSLTW